MDRNRKGQDARQRFALLGEQDDFLAFTQGLEDLRQRVPRELPDVWACVWIAFTFMLFDTLWTMTNVPYYALTAELTDDYDERASLTAFRMVLGVVGSNERF